MRCKIVYKENGAIEFHGLQTLGLPAMLGCNFTFKGI